MAPTFRMRRIVASVASVSALSLVATFTPAHAQSEPSLTQLVNAVSSADSEFRALALEMGALQEAGNKALADLREAQSRSEQARIGLESAQELLAQSQVSLERAQARLDELSRAAYRQGASSAPDAGTSADESLDRRTFLRQQVQEQQEVVDELERQRTEHANNESQLREAAELAEERKEGAAQAEADSRATLQANEAEIEDLAEQRDELVEKRNEASTQLAQARGTDPEPEIVPVAETSEVVSDSGQAPGAGKAEQVTAAQPEQTTKEDPYVGEDETDLDPDQMVSETAEDSANDTGVTEPVNELEDISAETNDIVETAIARAQSQIGVPYAWGGGDANGPTAGLRDGGIADANGDFANEGFDCSGLVLYAFAGAGVDLPHYTGYQYLRGTPVSHDEMQRGDLIFYGPNGSQHVAIYLGDGMMLEAPASGGHVQETPVRWSGVSPNAVRLI